MTRHPSRKTFTERIQDRLAARRNGEQGLALLDVLLGMAIFALIVIIAIQAIGQFRQRAFQTAASSDAKQMSIAIESHLTDNQVLPTLASPSTDVQVRAALPTVNLTRGNRVAWYRTAANGVDYAYCVEHLTGTTADAASLYKSERGAVTHTRRAAGCPAAADYAAALALTF